MRTNPIGHLSSLNTLKFVDICKCLYFRGLNSRTMKTHLFAALIALSPFYLFSNDTVFEIFCPDDVWVNCDAELWDLDLFGRAYYKDYSGQIYYIGNSWDTYHLNNCGTGYINREWTYEDPYWNTHTCTQTIWVEGGSFNYHNINWPEDVVIEGCGTETDPTDLPYGQDKPTYDYITCSQIGVNFEDDVFFFGPDCKKIVRTWTLIDWCSYDPNSNYNTQGYFTYVQIIKISNSTRPDIYCPADVVASSTDCGSTHVYIPDVNVNHATCGGYYSITHDSPYADHPGADASGVYPLGTTQVTFTVEYGCDLSTSCTMYVTVKDDRAPVAYCYASVTTALMPQDTNNDGVFDEGMIEIWAEDFNKDSFHPCGYGPLYFSFSSDITDTHATFTCENVGSNQVSMYVTGPNGGQTFCNVELIIQNNFDEIPNCSGDNSSNAYIQGRVSNPLGEGINEANLVLQSEASEEVVTEEIISEEYVETILDSFYNQQGHLVYSYIIDTVFTYSYDTTFIQNEIMRVTDTDGNYMFEEVPMNEMLFLQPEKEECDMSRITLADAQALHAYVTGVITFDHPYLHLAGDVDDNKQVDFNDLVHLIEFLTGESQSLPCEEPYWFVQEGANMDGAPFDIVMDGPIEVMMEEPEPQSYNMIAIMKGNIDVLIDEELMAHIIETSPLQDLGISTSVSDFEINNELALTPNPMNDFVDITLENDLQGKINISIYNLVGEKVYSEIVNKSGNTLNHRLYKSELLTGAYMIRLDANNKGWTKKLIVE